VLKAIICTPTPLFIIIHAICLQEWELLVLCKLKWDMATVTAQDFLELLVMRLHLGDLVLRDTVIRHAQTFIALATKGMFIALLLHVLIHT
jgi:hypothetical protein